MTDRPDLYGSSILCPECASTKRLHVCYPCMSHPWIDQNSYLSSPEGDFLYASVLSGDKIRLIELHGSPDDDDIRCSLVVRRLDDSLVYNALSYCWGDQNSKRTITCNGSHLEVGHNLYMAMRQIRRDNRTELLWADALCINQANNVEKATQVKMMRNIYQRSKLVIAWLGEEESMDHLAFQLMHLLNARFQLRWVMEDQRMKKVSHFSREELGLPDSIDPSWKALCGFLTRPFFFRVWIIQEILVAKECIFQFGEYKVDRKIIFGIGACMEEFYAIDDIITFNTPVNGSWADDSPIAITNSIRPASSTPLAINNLALHDVLSSSVYSVKSLWHFRSMMSAGQPPSITQLLSETKMFQATLPHDKIFALVGLASDLDPDFLDRFIDYDKPVVDIQIELAKVCMENRLSWGPTLFSYVDAQRQSNELPSWVPDWTRGGPAQRSLSGGFCHQNADRHIKWQLSSNNSMTIHGLLLDSVELIVDETPHMQAMSPRSRDLELLGKHFRELEAWTNTCFELAPCARPGYYIAGESILDAFWRTLIFNREYEGLEDAAPDMRKAYFMWSFSLRLIDRMVQSTVKQVLDQLINEVSKQPTTFLRRLSNFAFSILASFRMRLRRAKIYLMELTFSVLRTKGESRFSSSFSRYSFGRKFCTTAGGGMGWVPLGAERHDLICMFEECELPFVIRKRTDGFRLIGDCYIHGFMRGIPAEVDQSILQSITLV